ncbi:MAG: hypothetical protein ABSH09_19620 [Bryobacteraceae bacterium]
MLRLSALLLGLAIASAEAQPPRFFYTDLESGPKGAYVTISGKRFGPSASETSYVTVGGGRVTNYPCWSDTKICIQLSPSAATGPVVVTTPTGASNGVPFTVRSGRIFFVATTGRDSNSGSFNSPWRTLLKARDTMKPGDITYAMNGVTQTTDDGQGWNTCMLLDSGGKPGLPVAIVAYPGATVTMGNPNGPGSAIRSKGHPNTGNWVFAGLTLRGKNDAVIIASSDNWRIVNNDMSCPNGDEASACFETQLTSYVKFLGNNVHDAGKPTASALYHGVYFSTDSNHIEVAWNTISNVHGCRGIQFHSSPLQGGGPNDPTGHNQYDLSVHDNMIHDTQCDGIIFATVDPSQGKVEAYNNVIYNAGKGPANPENSGNWACIYASGATNTGPPGGGTINIYNNTLVNCGTFANPPYGSSNAGVMNGGHNPNLHIRVTNNIIFESGNIPFLIGPKDGISGNNNLFYGGGSASGFPQVVNTISKDPLFVNLGQNDFHLRTGSPGYHIGADVGAGTGRDGLPRDKATGFNIGAYQ